MSCLDPVSSSAQHRGPWRREFWCDLDSAGSALAQSPKLDQSPEQQKLLSH